MASESGGGRCDEVLDQQAWLMRLARRLGRDEAAAEELAQESLIAAWARPPRERGGALRAWLRSVLVHRVRTEATAERRRREREERSARHEKVAAADEIAERLELARRVAAALDELPEAERRALYLRYYEELSPPDIARAVGAPLGTIKSRLAQGRERLRRKLDRTYGERGAWLVLLAPLGAAPLPAPAHPPATPATAGASSPALIGALTMATKTTVALAAAAVLGVSLLVWKPWGEPASASAVVPAQAAVSPTSGSALHAPMATATEARAAEARIEVGTRAAESSHSATGQVEIVATHGSDGTPAAMLFGSLAPEHLAGRENGGLPIRQFQLDREGRSVLSGLEPGVWVARLNGREIDGGVAEVGAGATAEIALAIRPGLAVRGRVLDESDSPVLGAEIFSSWADDVSGQGILAITDGTGQFVLRDLAPWTQTGPFTALAARAPGHVTSRAWDAKGKTGDQLELVLRLEGAAGSLRGQVVDEAGAGVAGATLEFPRGGWAQDRSLSPEGSYLDAIPRPRLESGSDGSFSCDHLPPGPLTVSVKTDAHPVWEREVAIETGRTSDLKVVLQRGGILEGQVLDADGRPAQGARILAGRPNRNAEGQHALVPGWPSGEPERKASTDAEGRYRIEGLEPGPCEVRASLRFGRQAQTEVDIVVGQSTRWDVQLPRSQRVAGTLLDEAGTPLDGWSLHVIDLDRRGLWLVSTRTDAAGHFALENCPEGPKSIEVCVPETFAAPAILVVPFPDEEDVTLVVPDRARPSARIAGRFVDPSGVDVEGLEVWLSASEANWGKQIVPDRTTQAFEFGPLVPGSYRLHVQATGYVEPLIEVPDLAPGELRDLGDLALERGALLEIELAATADASLDGLQVELRTPLESLWTLPIEGRSWRSEQLHAGSYVVRVGGSQIAFHEARVELVAGETTHVTVPVEPGTARFVTLQGGQINEEVSIEVFDAQGKPFHGPVTCYANQVGIHGLTLGRWVVRYQSFGGPEKELEILVDSLAPQTETLTFVVR